MQGCSNHNSQAKERLDSKKFSNRNINVLMSYYIFVLINGESSKEKQPLIANTNFVPFPPARVALNSVLLNVFSVRSALKNSFSEPPPPLKPFQNPSIQHKSNHKLITFF